MSNLSLPIRRLLNAIISLIVGVAGCWFSVFIVLGTVWEDYGGVYIFFTILSIAAGVAIWLDHEKVLDTQILPH